ncbi:LPD1 domain-containing protein [Vitreoscilla stercoraria]|uniref:Large polyvalent protein-associated domain-containing protein n=1 Tax=Vitreoscilla stercoraria TaxID=61 RepID=A0ABY4ECB3_VITST|nr:LPD1 domain-containing protein [Vitreoscilla stercoraria]UOO93382.1 hypothetical protein LVJ81_04965 [Vitreoscilla stercoraria]
MELNTMERLRLNGELKTAIEARNAETDSLKKLDWIKMVQALRLQLGLAVMATEPEPVVASGSVVEPEPAAEPKESDQMQTETESESNGAVSQQPEAPMTAEDTDNQLPPSEDEVGLDEDDLAAAANIDDDLSDTTTAENYRWKDTAYIAGARKELAQKSILQAKRDGQRVNANDIDWDELAKDPRLSESLIVKDNVFGRVDWAALADKGMPSQVAYFISRVYANMDKMPLHPLSQHSQKNYVQAISNLRERLEVCLTFKDVAAVMNEIIVAMPSIKLMRMLYEDELTAGITFEENIDNNFKQISVRGREKLLSYDSQVWAELGERFFSWTSKSVNTTLRNAQRDKKYADWSNWCADFKTGTDGEGNAAPEGASKPKKPSFQLESAEDIERIGGQEVDLTSSQQLQDMFGFKGIQSGNWVLKDKSAAEFHMKNAAAAMLDMSDVLGIEPQYLGLRGNLALAFGARGKKGALAHYESSSKVINITKMKGGGSLGHEYFHALDNLIKDLSTQTVGSASFMGTSNPDDLPDVDLAQVFKALRMAMMKTDGVLKFEYPKAFIPDVHQPSADTKAFLESMAGNFLRGSRLPLNAAMSDLKKWIGSHGNYATTPPKTQELRSNVAYTLLVRHWTLGSESDVDISADGVLTFDGLPGQSEFYKNAIELDMGKEGKYWSKDFEMAARAFSAYLQDRLEEQGRKNDYLAYSTQGGNGRVGERAYPQGEERQRINDAFDGLFKVIREKKVLETATANKALMDSLFDCVH